MNLWSNKHACSSPRLVWSEDLASDELILSLFKYSQEDESGQPDLLMTAIRPISSSSYNVNFFPGDGPPVYLGEVSAESSDDAQDKSIALLMKYAEYQWFECQLLKAALQIHLALQGGCNESE